MALSPAQLCHGETTRLLPQAPRLLEPPYSNGGGDDDDDDDGGGDGGDALAKQDPKEWCSNPLKMGTFSQCIRYLSFLWNLVFLLMGMLVLATGVWGLVAKGWLRGDSLVPLGSDPMLLLLLLGTGTSTLSMAGCMGALRPSPCLLRFFLGAMGALVGVEVLGGLVLVLVSRQWLRDGLRDTLLLCLLHYQEEPDLRFMVDEVQRGLSCCGLGSYRDWEVNQYFNCSSPGVQACGVPASCCLDPLQNGTITNSQCGFGVLRLGDVAASTVVHLGGCMAPMGGWLRVQGGAIATAVAVLVLLEATGMLMALKVLGDITPTRVWD
ncbi:tetraspanin-10 [Heliangelus exortis]|uniref:tetraspanin-10 n=1 Tax=Heliangelus exortis TaxID=472823 RepID=UPI003A8D2250